MSCGVERPLLHLLLLGPGLSATPAATSAATPGTTTTAPTGTAAPAATSWRPPVVATRGEQGLLLLCVEFCLHLDRLLLPHTLLAVHPRQVLIESQLCLLINILLLVKIDLHQHQVSLGVVKASVMYYFQSQNCLTHLHPLFLSSISRLIKPRHKLHNRLLVVLLHVDEEIQEQFQHLVLLRRLECLGHDAEELSNPLIRLQVILNLVVYLRFDVTRMVIWQGQPQDGRLLRLLHTAHLRPHLHLVLIHLIVLPLEHWHRHLGQHGVFRHLALLSLSRL